MDDGLHASLNAGDVVSHGVHACLGGVDLDDVLKLGLAALEFVFPVFALGLAIFNQHVFWVLTFLEHLLHIAYTKSSARRSARVFKSVSASGACEHSAKNLPGVAMWGESLGSGIVQPGVNQPATPPPIFYFERFYLNYNILITHSIYITNFINLSLNCGNTSHI